MLLLTSISSMEAAMDVEQLTAFDRVVREGSFSRAALALGLGQPAVSARIQALEAKVGGLLFVRGRRIALTALGETFLPFARRALEVLGEGVAAAQLAQVGQRGRVRLGVLGSLAGGLAGPALARFLPAHPRVDVWMRSGDHEALLEQLLDGLLDLALLTWPVPEPAASALGAVLLLREPVPLVVHPRHALAGREADAAAVAVHAAPLIRLRWWQAHHPAVTALADRAPRAVELPMETARQLVASGTGAGFFARTYVADDLARGDLAEVAVRDLPRLHRDLALVRRTRSDLSPAGAALLQAIRAQASALGLLRAGRPAGPRRGRAAGAH
jgi:LysR family transcriptional regulator, low CO2-responsive transcriptional regulator